MVKEQEPMATVSVRIPPQLKKQFEDYVLDFNRAHFTPGPSMGVPQVMTETKAYRIALEQGLAVLQRGLSKKGGSR
jgi:hypothetical protein